MILQVNHKAIKNMNPRLNQNSNMKLLHHSINDMVKQMAKLPIKD